MATSFFPLQIVTQTFEDETGLSEALNFNEISRVDSSGERRLQAVRANAEEILKKADALTLRTKTGAPDFTVNQIALVFEPPRSVKSWREPVEIKFDFLEWRREDDYLQAFVPALNIAVVAKNSKEFAAHIEREIRAALVRTEMSKSLFALRSLERIKKIDVTSTEIAVELKTPKQLAVEAEKEFEEKSILKEIGTLLNAAKLKPAYQIENYVEILGETLHAKTRDSVLLIGKSGVGKTAIFQEFVRQRAAFGFEKTPFWTTSGARLVAGQTGFGMWQERCQNLVAEVQKEKAILHLGNLIELLEVGKSVSNANGIASFFRPKIARGELQIIVECTPEQLAVIEKRDANLLAAFQQIQIDEPDRANGLKILEQIAAEFKNAKISAEAIKTVESVHRRYAVYSAFPGKPAAFLRNLLENNSDEIAPSDVLQNFSDETGLPLLMLDDAATLDLEATTEWFENKVLGQSEAIRSVMDLIAAVKAKLTKPRRPIASLLFIGATGVGKTELTKALAEFFFRDTTRMIRFDMSEFATPFAVERLIGNFGADEGLLTAKMREQPFSVLLFDEFEKADAAFFDLLLQILGEGRLTDARGRTADFTNAVIVMTSNLGAETFARGTSGFVNNAKEKKQATRHFQTAVRDFLRPEIYNRIDRIVPFAPLDEKTALKIVALEFEKLLRRDGLRFRQIKLDFDKSVGKFLAEKGYDSRYGARPLRRAIERRLLAPLAAELNQHALDEKIAVKINVRGDDLDFAIETDANQKKRVNVGVILANQANRAAALRRHAAKFLASQPVAELEDERFQLIRLKERKERGRWVSFEDAARFDRLPKVQKFLSDAKNLGAVVARLEDEILLEIYGKAETIERKFADELTVNELLFEKRLLELLAFQFTAPDETYVEFYSENAPTLFRLIRAYLVAVEDFGGEATEISALTTEPQKANAARVCVVDVENKTETPVLLFGREIWRRVIEKPEEFFASAKKEIIGVTLGVRCGLANPRFGAETGLHVFTTGNETSKNHNFVWVQTNEFAAKFPPADFAPRDSLKNLTRRRVYDNTLQQIKDVALTKKFDFDGVAIAPTVKQAIDETLRHTANRLVGIEAE